MGAVVFKQLRLALVDADVNRTEMFIDELIFFNNSFGLLSQSLTLPLLVETCDQINLLPPLP